MMTKWRPKIGETYYTPYLLSGEAYFIDFDWSGDLKDNNLYENGLVCRTKIEALALAEKMLAVARERVENA